MKPTVVFLLSLAFLAVGSSYAKDTPLPNAFNQALAAVPAAELPAKAADLVAQTKTRDRQAATVSIVKTAVTMHPASAPAIVGAIARAVPDMASIAAGTAAATQPKQAVAIAKAAAAAAPSKVRKIVAAVCRAVPNQYRNIALAVAQAVPDAGKDTIKGVGDAFPGMKPAIENTLSSSGGTVVSVPDTLDQATRTFAASVSPGTRPSTSPIGVNPWVQGPAVGPPYHPLTGTPTNVTPSTSGEVPEGGRNYAAP